MVIGKIVTKLIQSLPSWEVTKYYGRVSVYHLKCLKYKIQTSEAWFNFKCKFMPGSLRNEIEYEETVQKKHDHTCKNKNTQEKTESSEVSSCQQETEPVNETKCKKYEQFPTSVKNVGNSYIVDEHAMKKKGKGSWNNEKYPEQEAYTTQENLKMKRRRKAKHAQ